MGAPARLRDVVKWVSRHAENWSKDLLEILKVVELSRLF